MFHKKLVSAFFFVLAGTTALAADFDRPIPQPQSSAVESWFALASLFLCIGLYAVHRMVNRR